MRVRVLTRERIVTVVIGFPDGVTRCVRCEGIMEGSSMLIRGRRGAWLD